jgi:hypothetical protein
MQRIILSMMYGDYEVDISAKVLGDKSEKN